MRKKLIQLKRGGEKCPYCGTVFIEDLDPVVVAFKNLERKKRSRAAKKGWKNRKAFENHPDRDHIKVL